MSSTDKRSWGLDQPTQNRMRWISGLILFVYVLMHFANHALGLISLEVMGTTAGWVKSFWRLPVMSGLLYGSLLVHVILSLWKLYSRRNLKMSPQDKAQLILGLAIPALMTSHVMGTRYANYAYDVNDTYAYVVFVTFLLSPVNGVMNALGLVAAWVHSCLGLHMWMRLRPGYTLAWQRVALVFATLFPTLSLGGYLAAGREISILAQTGEWMEKYFARLNVSDDAIWGLLGRDTEWVRNGMGIMILLLLLARIVRNRMSERVDHVSVEYLDGPTVRQPVGATLLEISRQHDIGHASVCGGRGRCSTCRVRIIEADKTSIETPSETEEKVLQRVGAGGDVRLACQLVPHGHLKVARLLPSDATMRGIANEPWANGEERVVAVMFADLRDFTGTSENRLPFDVVYLINQFSQSMGVCVERHGGRIDKFLGDGLMAIFGIDSNPQVAARSALSASADMQRGLRDLNERLRGDLDKPLRMGVGIHVGPVVLGNMGYGASRSLTAIGDTVNTASRLESETKTLKCDVCVSADALDYANISVPKSFTSTISVRGKKTRLGVAALNGDAAEKFFTPDSHQLADIER